MTIKRNKPGPDPMPASQKRGWRFSLRFTNAEKRIIKRSGITPDEWREWMVRRAEKKS